MWYSSQIFLKTKERATDSKLVYEHASEPRELIDHKARYSELSIRRKNDHMKNFDEKILHQDSDEPQPRKKVSKPFLLGILLTASWWLIQTSLSLFLKKFFKRSESFFFVIKTLPNSLLPCVVLMLPP